MPSTRAAMSVPNIAAHLLGCRRGAGNAVGGDDWKTVYFCARTSLGMFKAKIPGVPVPVTKKG
jgi:hypothetical protein